MADIVDMANTLPVFADKRLVIVKNAPFLNHTGKEGEKGKYSGEEERLLKYLSNPLQSTCLVFWQKGAVDKRRKIFKALSAAGQVLEIGPLKGTELSNWIVEEARKIGKKFEPKALEYIIVNSGNHLRNLKNELEKLSLYSGENKVITYEMVKNLVVLSVEGNIFNLVDSIGSRKGDNALFELTNLLDCGEPPVRILYMIARQFRLILLVKESAQRGLTEKQITTELGLHPFITGKLLRQGRNFTFPQLEKSLQLILESDVGLKTGLPPPITLETLVFSLTAL
jgi:DNA polymerase-3 subunit delta